MASLGLQFALHGSIVLFSGLAGGLFHARAIKQQVGEVAWRVVHAGGCSAGVMLLAIAVPVGWVTLGGVFKATMAAGLIGGTYLLVLGMYTAAIWGARGIEAGGTRRNRFVHGLYGSGATVTLIGGALLVIGLLRSVLDTAAA